MNMVYFSVKLVKFSVKLVKCPDQELHEHSQKNKDCIHI